jgi:hypothetical protein
MFYLIRQWTEIHTKDYVVALIQPIREGLGIKQPFFYDFRKFTFGANIPFKNCLSTMYEFLYKCL